MIEIMSARYEANALLAEKRWNRIVVDITGLLSKFAAQELFEFARGLSADLPGECSRCAGGPIGPGQTGQTDRGAWRETTVCSCRSFSTWKKQQFGRKA